MFKWLDRALEHRSRDILLAGVSPVFDPIRQDSRFRDFMRKAGLEPLLERRPVVSP